LPEKSHQRLFCCKLDKQGHHHDLSQAIVCPDPTTVSNVISMDDRAAKSQSRTGTVRDRRYAIRYPFAADAELLDLESGSRIEGVTSDISLGGCFVCTSKPFPIGTRTRITLKRKDQTVEALGVVRIVKPRIGMGVEFIDLEPPSNEILSRLMEQLRRAR
jgi:hypothetical protein